jgi:hypothetical protein
MWSALRIQINVKTPEEERRIPPEIFFTRAHRGIPESSSESHLLATNRKKPRAPTPIKLASDHRYLRVAKTVPPRVIAAKSIAHKRTKIATVQTFFVQSHWDQQKRLGRCRAWKRIGTFSQYASRLGRPRLGNSHSFTPSLTLQVAGESPDAVSPSGR